jgi:hypothetical protein
VKNKHIFKIYVILKNFFKIAENFVVISRPISYFVAGQEVFEKTDRVLF